MSRRQLVAELEVLAAQLGPGGSAAAFAHELTVYREEVRAQQDQLLASQRGLEEARDRYASLFDCAPVGYVTLDPQGVVVDVNEAAAALLGTTPGQLARAPLLGRVLSVDRPRFLEHLARCRAGEQVVRTELAMTAPTGKPVVVEVLTQQRRSEDGRLLHTALVDLTGRRAAEAKERRALAASAQAERDDRALRETSAAREGVLRASASALGTALTPVRLGLASLHRHDDLPDGVRWTLALVQRNLERAVRFVRHLCEPAAPRVEPVVDLATRAQGARPGGPTHRSPEPDGNSQPTADVPPGLRVLIAEPDADTADVLERLLCAAGAQVAVAPSLAGAMDHAGAVDVLVTAVDLPDGDASDLLRRLRRDRPVAGIAFGGTVDEAEAGRMAAAGFWRCLPAPLGADELLDAIADAAPREPC